MRTVVAASIGVLLFSVLAASAVLGPLDIGFADEAPPFKASVDANEGTNTYTLVEIDEGDNNEETVITLIPHQFAFSVNLDQGPSRGTSVTAPTPWALRLSMGLSNPVSTP